MVDGSNESLYYSDEELDPDFRTGAPLQKSFENVDVPPIRSLEVRPQIGLDSLEAA